MTIIAERNKIALIEVDGRYYVVGIDRGAGQVTSELASDSPADGGRWFGGISDRGVQYVANGRSESAARAAFRRASRVECHECGRLTSLDRLCRSCATLTVTA
jgi:hypothetical protein